MTVKAPKALSGRVEDNKVLEKFEINCDMGEGFGKWKMGPDEEIMPYIDRANVACGFHAGDYNIMEENVKMAKKFNVKVGSHPGFPDKIGFGRRAWNVGPEEVYRMIIYQTGALKAFLDIEGMRLSHIKPHGQLYFYIELNEEVMRAALQAAKYFGVPMLGAKNSHYADVAEEMGVHFIQEFYCDVDWSSEGRLVHPSKSTKKLPQDIYDSVYKCGKEDSFTSIEGNEIKLGFKGIPFSLCLHSDMPGALQNIKVAREAINLVNKENGYAIKA